MVKRILLAFGHYDVMHFTLRKSAIRNAFPGKIGQSKKRKHPACAEDYRE